MKPLHELSAVEAAAAIAGGRLTSEALVRALLERIGEREPTVQAWAHLDPDVAIAAARARDRSGSRGPLHGVPIGVKDVMDTASHPTEYGSPIYAGHRPPRDAACVALARRAGAVVLGKTVSTEFATFHPGKTRNPRDPRRTPGGSSSGSAAAVADFMVPLGTATQTAGSTIRPAAYCGVVGYKPSFGLVARSGTFLLADGLDTLGACARSIDDAALFTCALAGLPTAALAATLERPLRLGLYRGAEWTHVDAPSRALVEGAANDLRPAGHDVREVADLPEADALAAAHWTILAYESARSLAHERDRHGDALSAGLRALVDEGLACPPERYEHACDRARRARAALDDVFARVDALLTAAAPGEAPLGHASTGDPIVNRVWTMLHGPCITLPLFRGPEGMPVGLQLVGKRGEDAKLLAVARRVQASLA